MKKKLLYIGLGIVAVVLVFVGYHYVRFLQATARMKELSADLEKRIVEWEKKEYKRPPLFGPAVPGNAAEYYKLAIAKKIDVPDDFQDVLYNSVYERSEPMNDELVKWAKSYTANVNLLKKGVNAENLKPIFQPREEISSTMLSVPRQLTSYIVIILGIDLENNNKFSEALELYCTTVRFADDLGFGGHFIQMLVSIAISGGGQSEIQRLLLADKLSDE
ncbi:MAG: hypothetical protein WC980_07640 [Candidatus Brocadiia bacterium]